MPQTLHKLRVTPEFQCPIRQHCACPVSPLQALTLIAANLNLIIAAPMSTKDLATLVLLLVVLLVVVHLWFGSHSPQAYNRLVDSLACTLDKTAPAPNEAVQTFTGDHVPRL